MWTRWALILVCNLLAASQTSRGAPEGFPTSGNGLWYDAPGVYWGRDFLPVGNGFLAAMTPGGTSFEATQLNLESLWSGGPFQNLSYHGGNKETSDREATKQAMASIQDTIFSTGTATGTYVCSRSYAGAGYLLTSTDLTGEVSDYARWLDLDQAVARTLWTQGDTITNRTTFCSHPAKACVQHTASSASQTFTFAFSVAPEPELPSPNVTCLDDATLQVRGYAGAPGMLYEILFYASSASGAVSCAPAAPFNTSVDTANATLTVSSAADVTLLWVGDTEYSMDAGDAAHGFSFRGADPHEALAARLAALQTTAFDGLLETHVADANATLHTFALDLGQTPQLDVTTAALMQAYQTDDGNPYIEWLLFNFGRYLLWGSARGTLPANLQGKWGAGYSNAWGADANINIQMNLWSAEMTGLDVSQSMFDYMEKTWVPRGTQTAQNLYNIDEGWVTHNEMNIFGHTGMKLGDPQWANYPEANAWMMLHVWDHFDYTNDVSWWQAQGYPLLKSVAQFHLHRLVQDRYFNDSSLVTAPCNSPEQKAVTLGCAHAQQLVWQLFNAVDKGFEASGDTDAEFLDAIRTARDQMDKGIHIGSWGQLQEWKIDMDDPADVHRHLSHLIGLYPGYALASYDEEKRGSDVAYTKAHAAYTKAQVLDAAAVSLAHRGNGTGPDGDAGWEKVWRAAAWAQLGDADTFYHILTYAIATNFAENLFSVYNPGDADPIFQIDANLGHPAAVLNALIQAPDVATIKAPDVATYDDPLVTTLPHPLVITLLPALPAQWPSGSITGARVRGGMTVDMEWSGGELKSATITVGENIVPRDVQVVVGGEVVLEFTTAPGMVQSI
ncbi:glycoside hydrolase family 95 protein [Schizophyllum amplum]|uniref:Glycoside hydrolase family 95 protein n=1 Tax=Schizophyllum amplum TaxID=97359 RepID=A0A550BTW7_9AGAR|nr:glycoside hydrolase family 95 protein [Auriculariopsis ampla]